MATNYNYTGDSFVLLYLVYAIEKTYCPFRGVSKVYIAYYLLPSIIQTEYWGLKAPKTCKTKNNMKNIQDKIAKKEQELAQLKSKLEALEQADKVQWLDVSDFQETLGLEISSKPLHFNKTLVEQKLVLKPGEFIASYEMIQTLRNSKKYPNTFTDFWVNVFPNPDKICEEKGKVARFFAISDRSVLSCIRDPSYSIAALGVFVVRKKISKGKKK